MNRSIIKYALISFAISTLTACGGGSGSNSNPSSSSVSEATSNDSQSSQTGTEINNEEVEVTEEVVVEVVEEEVVIVEAPSVTNSLSNQLVTEGESVAFSVSATGSDMTYQWYQDGVALNGETNSQVSFSNITLAQAGEYAVIVSNAGGDTYSNTATLSVLEAITFGTAQITWDTPNTREDGSALDQDEILAYKVYYSAAADTGFDNSIEVNASADNSVLIEELEAGDYKVAISTIDVSHTESNLSAQFLVAIN